MIHCDYLVIGAGIIGLSTAYELQKRQPECHVVVVEKEMAPGFHQTGHNSGVIHAGVYYTPGSLKAQFCRQGNIAIKQFCQQHHIPFGECGKLLVATTQIELKRMQDLAERAVLNDIEFKILDHAELVQKEPNITGLGALLIPATGIVDYRQICLKLVKLIKQAGGQVLFNHQVTYIDETHNGVTVVANDVTLRCNKLLACGGLMADRIVRLLGDEPEFQIIPFRGDYYQLPKVHNQLINHLIYPIPDPDLPFLGVHLTRMIDGSVTVGPNAVINFSREGYNKHSVHLKDCTEMFTFPGFRKVIHQHFRSALTELTNSLWKPAYLKQVQKYCPQLKLNDLQPYPPGIRAQAVDKKGRLIDDFLFHRTKRALVVCNAPSPAATSCFPIAGYIVDQLNM
ncbi:L-2-hydroxyglutarate oxidase [Photobacterium lipolyticum]|uniref:L-2-hydroxyglutarate oxidase n=1 Tax=Photobacterium lipolyticum TaxID=266810 RepID=A0A2T3MYZ4_9GAMM|nr:L-2-hydroxyglutarate oxidase [Photobacterium lipolyticum]PSW05120.1 L-2-hydroxyglutarate oxidase [Photobacterium lipolyticum]